MFRKIFRITSAKIIFQANGTRNKAQTLQILNFKKKKANKLKGMQNFIRLAMNFIFWGASPSCFSGVTSAMSHMHRGVRDEIAKIKVTLTFRKKYR